MLDSRPIARPPFEIEDTRPLELWVYSYRHRSIGRYPVTLDCAARLAEPARQSALRFIPRQTKPSGGDACAGVGSGPGKIATGIAIIDDVRMLIARERRAGPAKRQLAAQLYAEKKHPDLPADGNLGSSKPTLYNYVAEAGA